jgi:glutathione S-transferase
VIADPSSDPDGKPTYVVESFDIAVYLDNKYPAPDYPVVFPRGTRAMQYMTSDRINQVGMLFAPIVLPLASMRADLLDERGQEYFARTRGAIFGTGLPKLLESAAENWSAAEARWDKISEVFDLNQGGPFVMGHQISFTDFVIGGVIHCLQKAEGGEMTYWKKMAKWHGGRWATLWEEIAKLEADSSEVV